MAKKPTKPVVIEEIEEDEEDETQADEDATQDDDETADEDDEDEDDEEETIEGLQQKIATLKQKHSSLVTGLSDKIEDVMKKAGVDTTINAISSLFYRYGYTTKYTGKNIPAVRKHLERLEKKDPDETLDFPIGTQVALASQLGVKPKDIEKTLRANWNYEKKGVKGLQTKWKGRKEKK